MKLQSVILYAFIVAVLLIKSNLAKDASDETQITKKIIADELANFIAIKDSLLGRNVNISVHFGRTVKDDDGAIKHKHEFTIGLINGWNDKGPAMMKDVGEKTKYAFKVASDLNISAIASHDKYSEDGSIVFRKIYVENSEIEYVDGVSRIIYEGKGEKDDVNEEEIEQFVEMLKEYELPVEVHKVVYNKAGNVISEATNKYQPKKVKLLGGDLSYAMKLEVAEALKQTAVTKDNPKQRIELVVKYLKVRYPQYTWSAVVGEGPHFIKKDVEVDLQLEDNVYKFFAVEA